MKKQHLPIDIQQLMEALAVEGRARKRLGNLSDTLKQVHEDGGKPSAGDLKKLQQAVRRWAKAASAVAHVIEEPSQKE